MGSSWGKIEKLTGEELQQAPPYCDAYDISAARRSYGALLLRQQQSQLLAYVLPADTQQAAGTAAQSQYCPVPCVTAAYDEPQRMAASRWGYSCLVAAGALPLGALSARCSAAGLWWPECHCDCTVLNQHLSRSLLGHPVTHMGHIHVGHQSEARCASAG